MTGDFIEASLHGAPPTATEQRERPGREQPGELRFRDGLDAGSGESARVHCGRWFANSETAVVSKRGCGCGGTNDVGIGRSTRVGGWEPPDLASQLRPLLAACHVEDIRISVTLEMTLVEIVELTASLEFPNDTPAAVRRKQQTCVEEALWDAAPMVRHIEPRASYNVALEAKR